MKAPTKHTYDEPDPAPPPTEPPPAPEKPPLDPKEVEALLRGGHKLVKRGDDPKTNWISMTRVGDQLALCHAVTEEAIADIVKQDLVLAE